MPVKDKKLQPRNKTLAGLQETVADMISELDLQVILQKAVERAAELVGADIVTIHVYDPLTNRVRAAAEHGVRRKKVFHQHEPGGGKAALRVVNKGKPMIAEDVSASEFKGPFSTRERVKSAAGFPLKVGADVTGVLFVNYRKTHKFEQEEIEVLVSFGNLVAIAIENANLIEQERQRANAMDLLQQVSAKVSASLDVEETLALIIKDAMRLTGTDSGVIHLVDEAKQAVIRSHEVPEDFGHLPPRFSQETGMTWTAISTGQPIAVSDITKDERVNPAMAEKGVRAIIGTPLKVEEEAIGVLFLNDSEPHEFIEYEKNLLSTLASQAAIAIQNARFFDSAQRRIRDLEIVNEVVQIISTRLDYKNLLQTIVSRIADQLNCTHCTLFFPQEEKGELLLVPQVTHGVRAEIMTRHFKLDEGLAGWVFQKGDSVVLDNVMDDPRFAPAREPREQPRSMLVAPVKVGDQTIGVISADQDAFGWFSESDRRLVDALAQQAGIAIQRAIGLALLQDIGNQIISLQKMDDILHQVVSGAIKLTNTTSGIIYLVSGDGKSVTDRFSYPPSSDHPEPRMASEESITRQVIKTGEVLIFPDAHQDARVNPVLYDRVRSMIAVPLKLEQKVIGVLFLNDADRHDFTETEVSLLSTLAGQAASAIQNARLFQERDERAQQLVQLQKVTATVTAKSSEDLDKVLHLIVLSLGDVFQGASCTIRLYDSKTDEFEPKVATGMLADLVEAPPRVDGVSRYVIKTKKPRYLVGDDLATPSDKGPAVRKGIRDRGVKASAHLPLMSEEDIIGVLYVDLPSPHRFSAHEKLILELFADQAAIAIENARLYEHISQNLERRIQELEVLTEMSRGAVSDLGIDQILDLVYEQMAKIMNLSDAQVQIAFYDEAEDEVSFPLAIEQDAGEIIDIVRWGKREAQYRGVDEEEEVVEQLKPRRRRDPPGLNEYVIRTEQPLLIVEDFERKAEEQGIKVWPKFGRRDRPTHSWLGVPMIVADRVIGVISIQSLEQERAFDEGQQVLLATVANQAAVAIENAALFEEKDQALVALREEQRKSRAASRLAAINTIAAGFVHRLNNVAGTIPVRVGQISELLDPSDPKYPKIAHFMDAINEDVDGILRTAQAISSSTETTEPLELVNVALLVSSAIKRVAAPMGIAVCDKCDEDLPEVLVFSGKLVDTLENLIRNGVQAIEGSGSVTIVGKTLVEEDQDWVAIDIEDTGRGIPPEALPRIFDLFFSTKGGMGFGLWGARTLIESLGGKITVSSEVGKRTTFTLLLPVEKEAQG